MAVAVEVPYIRNLLQLPPDKENSDEQHDVPPLG